MYPAPLAQRLGRFGRARLLALLAAPLLVLALLSATPSPAAVVAGPSSSAPPGVADFASLPGDAKPVAVTLITGDTVLWSDAGDGNPRVEIEEAPHERPVHFDQSGTQEDFYVIPSDVMGQVVSGALDRELFNVPSLIRQGLDDESTGGELPVIVTFDEGADAKKLERDADALPAASEAQGIEGIHGAGVKLDRGKAEKFRDTVLGEPDAKRGPSAQSDSLVGAVDKVLLDQMLEIDLSESVPQIGAPEAWDAGFTGEGVTVAVLDTGIDASHPDLQGQVVAAENFAGDGEPVDDNGHGTHVASTVAGTGAASDGARKGVAPDADLISGKVCNAQGQCPTSAIMAGMEWATTQGADVVNMSLGSGPTDGTDVLSQLVNQLSADTGALFVIAAGNSGCGIGRVGSPGAADAALAVGAVDKSDQMASFSSCGPRVGDHAVKPEITAPGVGIVAARAAGTDLGTPVDDHYTSLNGTSMATPHVAGAAALLAQAKPDLSWSELKDALVSNAADGGFLWYQQGTGRVDVPAALNSPVYATGTVNFGGVDGVAQQDITYTNHSDSDITLALEVAVTDRSFPSGQPTDGVSLSADAVTVPANGQASVTVTVDAAEVTGLEPYGGVVTATGPGVNLRTGVGFGPPLHEVTIEVLDSNGDRIGTDTAPDRGGILWSDTFDFLNPVGLPDYGFSTSDGIATGHVPTGTYTIMMNLPEFSDAGENTRVSVLTEVEVDIDADASFTLDAREAVPVEVTVPRKVVDRYPVEMNLIRSYAGRIPDLPDATFTMRSGTFGSAFATPSPPGKLAFLALFVHWTLAEPQPVEPVWGSPACPRDPRRCYSTKTPAYIYNLPFLYENGIPDNLHEKVTRADLVEVPTRYHADHPDALVRRGVDPYPPFAMALHAEGAGTQVWMRPGAVTEYYLADDRITWSRFTNVDVAPGAPQHRWFLQESWDRYLTAEAGARRSEERWFAGPLTPGLSDIREEVFGNPRGIHGDCAYGSRGGLDGNRFVGPKFALGSGRGHTSQLPASWRMWNLDAGDELEATPGPTRPGCGVPPQFSLAPEETTYRLEQTLVYPATVAPLFLTGPATSTAWEFTSGPSDATAPEDWCPLTDGRDADEPWERQCQIQPLIQLEYQLGLDINNRAPAGRAHVFTINAGHHTRAIDRADVTDLSVEASFDDGETWTDARVVDGPRDTFDTGGFLPSSAPYQQYRVVLEIPPLHRTNGYVSLRVQATDANGGTVDQTIHRAYALKCDVKSHGSSGCN